MKYRYVPALSGISAGAPGVLDPCTSPNDHQHNGLLLTCRQTYSDSSALAIPKTVKILQGHVGLFLQICGANIRQKIDRIEVVSIYDEMWLELQGDRLPYFMAQEIHSAERFFEEAFFRRAYWVADHRDTKLLHYEMHVSKPRPDPVPQIPEEQLEQEIEAMLVQFCLPEQETHAMESEISGSQSRFVDEASAVDGQSIVG
jgi:hypothetical protein